MKKGERGSALRVRERERLAPDSDFYTPELFPRKAMKAWETQVLSLPENENVQHADGKGAEVCSVDAVLISVYRQVGRDAHTGGWASAGTEDDPHELELTGDGCGATADESNCGLRAFQGSVNKSNQSVHGIRNLASWRGTTPLTAKKQACITVLMCWPMPASRATR